MPVLRWFKSYQKFGKQAEKGYPWRVVREWPAGKFVTLWWMKTEQEADDWVSRLSRIGTYGENDTYAYLSKHPEERG